MQLEWQNKRTDERGYRSTCNRYSVSSINVDGTERWEAWKLVPGGNWFAPLAMNLPDENAARAAAQTDFDARLI